MGGGVSGIVIFSKSNSLNFISIFRRVSISSCDSFDGIYTQVTKQQSKLKKYSQFLSGNSPITTIIFTY